MKKIILFLLLQLSCDILYITAQENYSLTYSYKSDSHNGDVATLEKIELTNTADVVIPETVEHDGFIYMVRYANPAINNRDFLRSISFPQSMKSISNFHDCENLTKVVLNNGLETIERKAFQNCTHLSFVEIPTSVSFIGKGAFTSTQGSSKINTDESRYYAFLKTAIIHCKGEFEVDNDASFANGDPFSPNRNLTTIVYTNLQAPTNWMATTRTYVPQKEKYNKPYKNLTSTPHIIEMVTFANDTYNYTGSIPSVKWTNNVEGFTVSLDLSVLNVNAGTYDVNIPATYTDGEHTFVAQIPYHYTINPVKITAKVSNVTRRYGEENPSFNITYSGFLSGDNENAITTKPSVTTTATTTSGIGDYPITISGGSATNYDFVYEPGVLTVKAPLSAKVNDASKVYGEDNPAFTIEYYGLKNGEEAPAWTTRPTFQTVATQKSEVGQYEVKAVNGLPVNYEMGEITAGTLNITPAPLTIKVNDAVRQYYAENPAFSYACEGFVNGEDESALSTKPTLSTSATQSGNVGTYEIKAFGATSKNYSISHVNGTLTITPRSLTASVGNYERLYNEENPEFVVQYDGFVGNEDETVLNQKPTASTTATKTTDVGTYPINVSGGSADNYNFSYTDGVLTINKAEQTISWEQDLKDQKVGDQVELNAVASSGLPITYTIESGDGAEIYSAGTKTFLECKADGQILIRAVQEGNNNYYSSPRVSKTVVIKQEGDDSVVNSVAESSVKIQETSFGVRMTGTKAGEVIHVFTPDGMLQKSVIAVGNTTDIYLERQHIYIIIGGKKTWKLNR